MKKIKRWDKSVEMDVYQPTSQDEYNEIQRDECLKMQREFINLQEQKYD